MFHLSKLMYSWSDQQAMHVLKPDSAAFNLTLIATVEQRSLILTLYGNPCLWCIITASTSLNVRCSEIEARIIVGTTHCHLPQHTTPNAQYRVFLHGWRQQLYTFQPSSPLRPRIVSGQLNRQRWQLCRLADYSTRKQFLHGATSELVLVKKY